MKNGISGTDYVYYNDNNAMISNMVLVIDTILIIISIICLSCICALGVGTMLGYFGRKCSNKPEKYVNINGDDDDDMI